MQQVSVDNEEKEIADDKNQLKAESSEEYQDVSVLSVDENNPGVIQQNEELRHTLESSNYINWLIDERKKKEKIESIIAEKEIDLEKAKDNPCYDTMKAEWLKDKQKMTYRESAFFADKCRQSMSEWEKMFPNNMSCFAKFFAR
ncbi:Sodium-coupled monocarboxylate transporter 1 [Bienertia sinuspersici]